MDRTRTAVTVIETDVRGPHGLVYIAPSGAPKPVGHLSFPSREEARNAANELTARVSVGFFLAVPEGR